MVFNKKRKAYFAYLANHKKIHILILCGLLVLSCYSIFMAFRVFMETGRYKKMQHVVSPYKDTVDISTNLSPRGIVKEKIDLGAYHPAAVFLNGKPGMLFAYCMQTGKEGYFALDQWITAMGGQFQVFGSDGKLRGTYKDKILELTLGETKVTINNKTMDMQGVAIAYKGHIYLPLSLLARLEHTFIVLPGNPMSPSVHIFSALDQDKKPTTPVKKDKKSPGNNPPSEKGFTQAGKVIQKEGEQTLSPDGKRVLILKSGQFHVQNTDGTMKTVMGTGRSGRWIHNFLIGIDTVKGLKLFTRSGQYSERVTGGFYYVGQWGSAVFHVRKTGLLMEKDAKITHLAEIEYPIGGVLGTPSALLIFPEDMEKDVMLLNKGELLPLGKKNQWACSTLEKGEKKQQGYFAAFSQDGKYCCWLEKNQGFLEVCFMKMSDKVIKRFVVCVPENDIDLFTSTMDIRQSKCFVFISSYTFSIDFDTGNLSVLSSLE